MSGIRPKPSKDLRVLPDHEALRLIEVAWRPSRRQGIIHPIPCGPVAVEEYVERLELDDDDPLVGVERLRSLQKAAERKRLIEGPSSPFAGWWYIGQEPV